jgi:hypothetical protein
MIHDGLHSVKQIAKSKLIYGVLIVFLATLQSFYNYNIGLAVFPVSSFALIILLGFQTNFSIFRKKKFVFLVIILMVTMYGFIIGLLNSFANVRIQSSIAYVMGILSFIVFHKLYSNSYNHIIKIVKLVLSMHVLFYFTQVLLYFLFSFHLDLIVLFSGEPQRIFGGYLLGKEMIRMSGLFVEPGTYSATILPLMYLHYITTKRVDILFSASVVTIILTFSASAYVVLSVFLLFVFFSSNKAKAIPLFVLVLIFAGVIGKEYVTERFLDRQDSSLISKLNTIQEFVEYDMVRISTGSGLGVIDCNGCIINDQSIFFYVFFTFGFIGIILIFAMLGMIKGHSLMLTMAFVLMMLSKLSLTHLVFWIYLSLFVIVSENGQIDSRVRARPQHDR